MLLHKLCIQLILHLPASSHAVFQSPGSLAEQAATPVNQSSIMLSTSPHMSTYVYRAFCSFHLHLESTHKKQALCSLAETSFHWAAMQVLGDRSLKLKYLNPNLLLLATGPPNGAPLSTIKSPRLTVSLLDTVTGQVLFRQSHQVRPIIGTALLGR